MSLWRFYVSSGFLSFFLCACAWGRFTEGFESGFWLSI